MLTRKVERDDKGVTTFAIVDGDGAVIGSASSPDELPALAEALGSRGVAPAEIDDIVRNASDLIRTQLVPCPPGWDKDELSGFLDQLQYNQRANFYNARGYYQRLNGVAEAFKSFTDGLVDPEHPMAPFFFMRAQAAFLGAASLGLGGMLPEAQMAIRGCLESSLYGYKVANDHEAAHVWLERNESEDATKACRKAFGSTSKIVETLRGVDAQLAGVATTLYERTIDWGAHPNQHSILGNMERTEDANGTVTWELQVMNFNPDALELCLKSIAQAGVCALMVFGHVFPKRYKEVGLSGKINKLASGL